MFFVSGNLIYLIFYCSLLFKERKYSLIPIRYLNIIVGTKSPDNPIYAYRQYRLYLYTTKMGFEYENTHNQNFVKFLNDLRNRKKLDMKEINSECRKIFFLIHLIPIMAAAITFLAPYDLLLCGLFFLLSVIFSSKVVKFKKKIVQIKKFQIDFIKKI